MDGCKLVLVESPAFRSVRLNVHLFVEFFVRLAMGEDELYFFGFRQLKLVSVSIDCSQLER